jgi:hypothetical protein
MLFKLQLIIGVLFVAAVSWRVVLAGVNWHDVGCIG